MTYDTGYKSRATLKGITVQVHDGVREHAGGSGTRTRQVKVKPVDPTGVGSVTIKFKPTTSLEDIMNQVMLVGRVATDIEVKQVGDKSLAKFRLAVKGRGDDQFFSVVCWGRTAEVVAEFCGKGRQVALAGRLNQNCWTAQDDDSKRFERVEVVASEVQFLGPKPKTDSPVEEGAPLTDEEADALGF